MRYKIIVILLLIVSVSNSKLFAQETYFSEIGFSGGCGFVFGDSNNMLFNWVEPLGGAFIKYKFNGHYELRLQLDGGALGIKKEAEGVLRQTYFATQAVGEFNFFNYGGEKWEAYHSWISPTVLAGVGLIVFDGRVAATLPMGIGVKMKLSERVNLGAYWTVSKVFSDSVDFVDDPIGLNKGFWNNRDWYSTAQIYLSFDFWSICAPCRDGRKRFRDKPLW